MWWLVIVLVSLPVLGLVWEAMASMSDRRRFPPPGRLVDIGGRRLHVHCTGKGEGPTVVLETGRFNVSAMWELVQAEVSGFARVCSYDRAGYAWSDPDPGPRTADRVAADLHSLLQAAEIPGPYLLVGHSLGGMYVRSFAQRYPAEVCGVILVDPYTEGEYRGQPPALKALQVRFFRQLRLISPFGLARLVSLFAAGLRRELHRFSRRSQTMIIALSSSARLWRAVDNEWREIERVADQLGGPGSLGDTPLIVLSSARRELQPGNGLSQADVEAHWQLMKQSQADLIRLSSRGRLVTLDDVGHGVPQGWPETIVDAVRELYPRDSNE